MPKLLAGFVAPPGKHECFPEASCVRLGFYEIDCMERSVRLGLYEIDRMERTQRLMECTSHVQALWDIWCQSLWCSGLDVRGHGQPDLANSPEIHENNVSEKFVAFSGI